MELYRHAGIRVGGDRLGDVRRRGAARVAAAGDSAPRLHAEPHRLRGGSDSGSQRAQAEIRGLEIAEEPPFLRHFSARFRPL